MARLQNSHRFLGALILVVSLLAPAAMPVTAAAARLQPAVAQLAAQSPDQILAVIVQKADRSGRAEALVTKLGGRVTRDLSIINAFAAELAAGAVRRLAADSAVRWVSLDGRMQSSGISTARFHAWSSRTGTAVSNGFSSAANALGPTGPDGLYASAGRTKGAFGGFLAEYSPGLKITKMIVKLRLYTAKTLATTEVLKVIPYVGGQALGTYTVAPATLNTMIGASLAATVDVDISAARAWTWADFNSLEIVIDQSALSSKSTIFHDAVGVKVFADPGTDASNPLTFVSSSDDAPVNTSVLANVFPAAVRAVEAWNTAPYFQGSGVTVAVVDSGTFKTNAIGSRLIGEVNFNSTEHTSVDQYGHGTFVASVVADDGSASGGKYTGSAPRANVLGVRISDDYGMGTESDLVGALQWIYTNKAAYNIRVVNLSLNAATYQSYHTSPLDAAVEILWFNGIVVVVSAGNNGTATLFPPANDPFVITVGATDDLNTASLSDDVMATFSAYGADEAGQAKPDLVAPGRNIIAYLPDTTRLTIAVQHPENRVDQYYFRMSGTSMSAPIVAGATAILIQDEPGLTPDQVKYRLKATANKTWPGYNGQKAGAGYLDVFAAVNGTTTQSANTGLTVSNLLQTGTQGAGSIWGSVNWNSVNWNSVNWNSVNWNSVNWNSDYWAP